MHHYLLTCALGLEALAKKELQKLGVQIDEVQDKAIYFSGGIELMPRVNIWSRFGNTLYYVLDSKKNIRDFDVFFEAVGGVNWKDYIPENYEVRVWATSIKSELGSLSSLQSLAKKAIVKKILQQKNSYLNPLSWKEKWATTSLSSQEREYKGELLHEDPNVWTITIQILMRDNHLKILLNTSGEGLHKRGYREMTGDAPLKENIAAALVILSGWRFKEALYDIFCGSGTIAIEAAMIARNMAPGAKRIFAFESWEWIPKDLLESEKEAAKNKEFSGEYKIYCSDIRKDIIEIAKRNAHFAGVGENIKFTAQDYTSYLRREISGTLVSNPPYGLRLEADVEQIHRDIAKLFAQNTKLWGGIISAHSDFEYYENIKYKRRKLYNGGEQVYFYKKEAK